MPTFDIHSGDNKGPLGSANMVPILGANYIGISSESDDEPTECLDCSVSSDGVLGEFSMMVLASGA